MSTPADSLLGRVAVASKAITVEQLAEATKRQGRPGNTKNLGELLLELGFLNQGTLAKVLELQKSVVDRAKEKRVEAAPAPAAPVAAKPAAARPAAAKPAGAKSVELDPAGDGSAVRALAKEAAPDRPQKSAAPVPASAPKIRIDGPLDELLAAAAAQGASDIHFHTGSNLRLRLRSALTEIEGTPIKEADTARLILPLLDPEERAIFDAAGEIDFCHTVPGLGRFRTNLYRQLRGLDCAMRRISIAPPTLEDLGLPNALAKFTNFHQGMVLVTGPSSCGKSSTLAALVNLINEERSEHILTIEDPIEYLHPSKRCLVNQRQAKRHTESFARALRAALREDPDVIVIGELRDRETISLAMTAAETGHFVLATLHTDNAARTVNRIIGSFSPDQQDQVRAMLSESLRAVISQRLLPRADGRGMVPATEVMVVTRAVGNLIRENKTVQIRSLMQTGSATGMNLLDSSLAALVKSGTVTREAALLHAEDPKLV